MMEVLITITEKTIVVEICCSQICIVIVGFGIICLIYE